MEEPLKSGDGLSYNGCEYLVATESYLPMLEPLRSVLVLRFSESLEAVAPLLGRTPSGQRPVS